MNFTHKADNSNNGLITKIWGQHLWEALHAISFGYPLQPTNEQKEKYMRYFRDTSDVLPCIYCRKSYLEFITNGEVALLPKCFESRATLTRWLYDLHEAVNKKLGVTYGVTYEDVVERYESFRAKCVHNDKGCIMPLDLKAQSYKKADQRNAPLIEKEMAKKFINYGKMRNLEMEELIELISSSSSNISMQNARNKLCWEIIKEMRTNGESSVEINGKFEGLPTINELKLISMLSTTIGSCDYGEIIKRLDEI